MEEDEWKDSALVKEDEWNRVMVGLDVKGRWVEGY